MIDPLKDKLKVLADAYHTYRETADKIQKEQRDILDKAMADVRQIQISKAKGKIDSLLH